MSVAATTMPYRKQVALMLAGITESSVMMLMLHTPRLILRDLVEADWRLVYALSQELSVTQYQTWLRLHSMAEAQQWVRNGMKHNALRPRQAYNLAIEHQHQAIGWLGWGKPTDGTQGDYDCGYALLPSRWGHGFMREALHEALGYMFQTLGARQVFGECASGNTASARVMEKVGMTLSATWSEPNDTTDASEEHRRYTIDVTAWQNARQIMPVP